MKQRMEEGSRRIDEMRMQGIEVTVPMIIKELGIENISDEQLDRELDEMIIGSDWDFEILGAPNDREFGIWMGEARRRFLYRKDLDVVAKKLREKLNQKQI
jgi:hypothetical protein